MKMRLGIGRAEEGGGQDGKKTDSESKEIIASNEINSWPQSKWRK